MKVLEERSFPVDEFYAYASNNSSGRSVVFRGEEYPVQIINPASLAQGTILLGATSADIARTWVRASAEHGATVIDNSSAFRMDPLVPLVVPEVNPHSIDDHTAEQCT